MTPQQTFEVLQTTKTLEEWRQILAEIEQEIVDYEDRGIDAEDDKEFVAMLKDLISQLEEERKEAE